MFKMAFACLLCVLTGCSNTAPTRQFGPCQTEPGSYACQVDRYLNDLGGGM